MRGVLESINVSRGGAPKTSVFEALVSEEGVSGDLQRDLRFHGGPDRAVSLFSYEIIEALQLDGHPIAPGSAGENLTISGLDWQPSSQAWKFRSGRCDFLSPASRRPAKKSAVHSWTVT